MDTPQVDPRDPVLRIEKLLDPGTCQLLTENNKCGMVAATGSVAGNKVIVFASDATVKSGALGIDGSKVIVVINTDAEAPFFKAADYGIVGDAFEVLPRFTEAVKRFRAAQH